MIDVRELQQRIDGMYVEPYSDEGQAAIHEDGRTHVTEVWEDGELTTTKCGDLYGARRIHRREPPFLPEGKVLFSFEEIDDRERYEELRSRDLNKRMVVTDDELLEILAEYRDLVVDQELIEFLEEHDYNGDE